MGLRCRYDGGSKPCEQVIALREKHELIPVCPEQLGGLPTPRTPAEIQQDGRVVTRDGRDVTGEYALGAEQAVKLCELLHCDAAVLKARSPSCGCGLVYDGTFTGALIPGLGIAAKRLSEKGIPVCSEESLASLPLLRANDAENEYNA